MMTAPIKPRPDRFTNVHAKPRCQSTYGTVRATRAAPIGRNVLGSWSRAEGAFALDYYAVHPHYLSVQIKEAGEDASTRPTAPNSPLEETFALNLPGGERHGPPEGRPRDALFEQTIGRRYAPRKCSARSRLLTRRGKPNDARKAGKHLRARRQSIPRGENR